MKTPPNKPVCDAIMYHITTVSAESKNPAGKHFGRKMLRDTINMHVDCMMVEFNVAIQWLIDNKYLKPLGQHTVGIGTGKDIKVYPLGDYKPYTTVSPDSLTVDLAVADGEDNTPPPKNKPESDGLISGTGEALPPRGHIKLISDDVPSFVTKEARDFLPIEQSLNTLKARLNSKAVENLNIKLRTLDELASLLPPEISGVLNQIHNDLKRMAQ